MDTKKQLIRAKKLLKAKRYEEARVILKKIDHPTARKWLVKLDTIAPEKEQKQKPNKLRRVLVGLIGLALVGCCVFTLALPEPEPAPTPQPETVTAQAAAAVLATETQAAMPSATPTETAMPSATSTITHTPLPTNTPRPTATPAQVSYTNDEAAELLEAVFAMQEEQLDIQYIQILDTPAGTEVLVAYNTAFTSEGALAGEWGAIFGGVAGGLNELGVSADTILITVGDASGQIAGTVEADMRDITAFLDGRITSRQMAERLDINSFE